MTPDRRPTTLDELLDVHALMTTVLGPDPERFDNPTARAVYLLDADRIRAATQQEKPS